jgi:hypothetical protein
LELKTMTTAIRPPGISLAAQYLDKASKAQGKYFSESAAFGKQSAYEELLTVWEECKTSNWDGQEAFPVKEQTLNNARSFIDALPLGHSLPSVGAEPDGHLTLEWYRHPRWTISISISPEGVLYYAALFGESSTQDSEPFLGQISQSLLNLIKQANIA